MSQGDLLAMAYGGGLAERFRLPKPADEQADVAPGAPGLLRPADPATT